MNQTFKVGDRVYFPIRGNKIYKLTKSGSATYPLAINFSGCDETFTRFTRDGKYNQSNDNPSIFHITEENRKLLNSLYGIEFEKPTSLLDHHLSLGSKVLCLIAKSSNDLPNKIWEVKSDRHFIDVISNRTSSNHYQNDNGSFIRWDYIYPIEVTSTGQINYLS